MGAARPWEEPIEPFRMIGNLYFAGTVPASVHVLDTDDGLIVFDVGYQSQLHLVVDSIYRLGFDPRQIKFILITHGHIDHLGGAAALRRLSGAKIAIGAPDAPCADGTLDLTYAKELGLCYHESFTPDILLHDGDVIELGNTRVRAVATPGHTRGAMSYIFNVRDGEKEYIAGLHGGQGMNTLSAEYLLENSLPLSLRDDFLAAMDRLEKEKVDIFLGNHFHQNRTGEKFERLKNGDRLAFVGPAEWAENARGAKLSLEKLIEKEK